MVKTDKKKLDNFSIVKWTDYQNLENFNKVSFNNLIKALRKNGRISQQQSYICGMHAVNICLLMWGYTKKSQYTTDDYPYTYIYNPGQLIAKSVLLLNPVVLIYSLFNTDQYYQCQKVKWGLQGEQFLHKVISPKFQSKNWACQKSMPWNLIDGTNYQTSSVIILIKCYDSALSVLHYMVIIGKRNDGKEYLLIDDAETIYLVSSNQLAKAMKIDTPTLYDYNAYRVG